MRRPATRRPERPADERRRGPAEVHRRRREQFGDVTTRLVGLQGVRNQFAIVLDKQVISAPTTQAAITNGQASITGNFTIESARALANQLKFGALPMSFALQTQDDISPTLGSEQLKLGLLAGLIGMLLVVIYSLLQYRLLGLRDRRITARGDLAHLRRADLLRLGVQLPPDHGRRHRRHRRHRCHRDSFIVYFERIRDEVREGRPLVAAVEAGWARARRTILAADAVNFLAAAVLYFLAASNVRGFAFTLGVTTSSTLPWSCSSPTLSWRCSRIRSSSAADTSGPASTRNGSAPRPATSAGELLRATPQHGRQDPGHRVAGRAPEGDRSAGEGLMHAQPRPVR